MVKIDEYIFVEGKRIFSNANSKGAIFRIRSSDHSYVDRYDLPGDAEGIVKDKNNHLWVAVAADSASSAPAALKCFDKDFNVITSYSFTSGVNPHQLQTDSSGDNFYFLSGDIYRCMNVSQSVNPVAFIASSGSNFYAFAVDPISMETYTSDALDYVQSSRIQRYDNSGQLIHSFTAGVISGNFVFAHE